VTQELFNFIFVTQKLLHARNFKQNQIMLKVENKVILYIPIICTEEVPFWRLRK